MKSKRTRVKCVCSLVNKISILYGNRIEGEIYFKHRPKCRFKETSGSYEWRGAGFKKLRS